MLPRDHLRPTSALLDKSKYKELNTLAKREKEENERVLEKGLVARGFFLDKRSSRDASWRGPNGITFTKWYVTFADRDIGLSCVKDILTAIDMGAKSINIEWDVWFSKEKIVVSY